LSIRENMPRADRRFLKALTVALLVLLHGAVGATIPPDSTYFADLPPDEAAALAASASEAPLPDNPRELLERIFLLAPAFRFDAGLVVVDTDRRWFRTASGGTAGAPWIEVRRWPGDTVIAVYVLPGARTSAQTGADPPVPGATFGGPDESDSRWIWRGRLETESGERPIGWEERTVKGSDAHLGILMVPGDAGLGTAAVAELYVELEAVSERVFVRSEAWESAAADASALPVALPKLSMAPEAEDERTDSWQIARGANFTLGLPPGLRSRRLYPSFAGPRKIAEGVLWMRGAFTSAEGERVVVGDKDRGGYVAEIRPIDTDWSSGKTPPRGAPEAELVAGAPFDVATERTSAVAARAERWKAPGFEGDWIVFRLVMDDVGVEIGLPVVEGRRSETLFWIPLTWRGPREYAAPPPVDPARRFGITFDRLTRAARKNNPWSEGYLEVPGMRLELPVGWWPVANLRSDNGFPVQLLDATTRTVGRLLAADPADLDLSEGGPWTPIKRPGRYHASAVYEASDGGRLYVAQEGHAFLLAPDGDTPPPGEEWERLLESALVTRPGR